MHRSLQRRQDVGLMLKTLCHVESLRVVDAMAQQLRYHIGSRSGGAEWRRGWVACRARLGAQTLSQFLA